MLNTNAAHNLSKKKEDAHFYEVNYKKMKRNWFFFIAIRILFPPILLWDFLRHYVLGRLISYFVLPAQRLDKSKSLSKEGLEALQTYGQIRRFEVETYDGAKLDTIEMRPESLQNVYEKKYIIHFVGNFGSYEENLTDMLNDMDMHQCTVIGFNCRGVKNSTGAPRSYQDLIIDGITQVQRLLMLGVPPENIILKGHSLGAALATLVAAFFHLFKSPENKPISVFNDRSFSSITDFIVGHMRLKRDSEGRAFGGEESKFKIVLSTILRPLIAGIVFALGWEIKAAQAFKQIPDANKEYFYVRSAKADRHKNLDDAVIPPRAHLANNIKTKPLLKERIQQTKKDKKLSQQEKESKLEKLEIELAAEKDKRKARKMRPVASDDFNPTQEDAHSVPARFLSNCKGVAPDMLFFNFVENVPKPREEIIPNPIPCPVY